MQLPKIHSTRIQGGDTLHYCRFSGVTAFHEFVDRRIPKLRPENAQTYRAFNKWVAAQLAMGSEVFGKEIPDSVASLNAHHVFTQMHLLARIRPKIQSKLHAFLHSANPHAVSTSHLEWNDRGIGVFSFAMASMGLFKSIPEVTGQEKGLPVQVEKLKIALQLTRVGSSVRKSYVHFTQKKGSRPALALYIMSGANANVEGDALYYVGITCAELTAYLESRGIPVAIHVVLATFWDHQLIAGVITIKHFEAALDVNQLLLLSSDPKYFRYRGCKALIALGDYVGLELPKGLGKHYPGMHQGIVDTITEGKGIAFGQSYSIEEAVQELTHILMEGLKLERNTASS